MWWEFRWVWKQVCTKQIKCVAKRDTGICQDKLTIVQDVTGLYSAAHWWHLGLPQYTAHSLPMRSRYVVAVVGSNSEPVFSLRWSEVSDNGRRQCISELILGLHPANEKRHLSLARCKRRISPAYHDIYDMPISFSQTWIYKALHLCSTYLATVVLYTI